MDWIRAFVIFIPGDFYFSMYVLTVCAGVVVTLIALKIAGFFDD
jgi:hypothetical protein